MSRLDLYSIPDRYGFLHGTLKTAEGNLLPVKVLPPMQAWDGSKVSKEFIPHSTHWEVYVDEHLLVRVSNLDDDIGEIDQQSAILMRG